MIARLLVAGLAWLAAMALFAAALQWSGHARPIRPMPVTALARALSTPEAEDPAQSWFVTRATSAHHMLVVDVEATQVDQANDIATRIVARAREHAYDEILIYVRRIGEGQGTAGRRVQWTPAAGFVMTVLADEDGNTP